MATVNKLPNRVDICCSPAELRKLADKMEATIAKTALGESTLVETWVGNDVELLWNFDQEAAALIDFIEVPIEALLPGDVIRRTFIMEPHVQAAVELEHKAWYDQTQQCWCIKVKDRERVIRFARYSHEDNFTFQVRRKR